jgi:CHAT domain
MSPFELQSTIFQLLENYQLSKALDLLKTLQQTTQDYRFKRDIIELGKIIRRLPPPKNSKSGYDDPACLEAAEQIRQMTARLASPPTSSSVDIGDISAVEESPQPTSSGSAPDFEIPIERSQALPKPAGAMPVPQPVRSGGMLHNIPSNMEADKKINCLVRIAFDKIFLKRAGEKFDTETIRDVEVSEVMEVVLEDAEGGAFKIETDERLKMQFISPTEATEWQFAITPLKSGAFSLRLRITQFKQFNGMTIPKQLSHLETITVKAKAVKNTEGGVFSMIDLRLLTDVPKPDQQTILFMGASPPGTRQLDLNKEQRKMVNELKGKFKLKTDKFLTAADIPRLLLKTKPSLVHFSGHGKNAKTGEKGEILKGNTRGIADDDAISDVPQGGIVVFNETGKGLQVIDDDVVENIFQTAVQKLNAPIQVVVFNSCYSHSQAERVSRIVPFVVGTARAISDELAIAFTAGFYEAIAMGSTIQQAFQYSKLRLFMKDKTEKDLVVLFHAGQEVPS